MNELLAWSVFAGCAGVVLFWFLRGVSAVARGIKQGNWRV